MLIALEGIDSAGKTTLLDGIMREGKLGDTLGCKEFDSPFGPQIRADLRHMTYLQKIFAFALDRAYIYEDTALPALDSGRNVLWDRYKYSAFAYRSAGSKEEKEKYWQTVVDANSPFRDADLVLYLKIPVATALARERAAGKSCPYDAAALEKVAQYYDSAAKDPAWVTLDADVPPESLLHSALQALQDRLKN